MSKKTIVLCHGWGFDPKFWSPLTELLRNIEQKVLHLGYFHNKGSEHIQPTNTNYLGIAHSFGVIKLLSLFENKLSHLVCINGFINFLGSTENLRKRRTLELKKMTHAFQQKPLETLQNFQAKVLGTEQRDHQQLPVGKINFVKLLDDLKNLTSSVPIPKIPLLILASRSDKIIPTEILNDNFPGHEIKVFEEGGHNLVGTSPLLICDLIKDFFCI